jgi:glycogen synthase
MNVLMLGWELPPHITGGLGVACEGLLHGLHALGTTSVTFVMPKLCGEENGAIATFIAADSYAKAVICPGDSLAVLFDGFVGSRHIDNTSVRMRIATSRDPSPHLSVYGASQGIPLDPVFDYAARMPALMKNITCDVIHSHDWLTLPAGVVAKQYTSLPLVAHMHSTEVERAGERVNPDVFAVEREGLRWADRVVAVSHSTRQVLITHYGVDPRKVDVIYNAADHFPRSVPRRRAVDTDPVVLFVGRMTHQKGPRHFIEAASLVLRQFQEAHFVMAGDGDLLPMMKSLVKLKGLQSRFHFPGFLDASSVRSWLTRADVYVMPSVAEPFGIGALEAIRAGVPVVISQRSGVTEVIDHLYSVDASDARAIADAVVDVLVSPTHAYQQVQLAQQEEARLSWPRSAEAMLVAYQAARGNVPSQASVSLSFAGLGG